MFMPSDVKCYIGMAEEIAIKTAESFGYKVVVWDADPSKNKFGAITCEINPRRLQLNVKDGIVTSARIG